MVSSETNDLSINSTAYQSYRMIQSCGTMPSGDPTSSKGLHLVPAQHSWGDLWELSIDLLVEVNTSRENVVAVTYLTVQEYGIGDTLESAIGDLLTSLSDYYQSLESREANLAPSAIEDLRTLRYMIRMSPADAYGH